MGSSSLSLVCRLRPARQQGEAPLLVLLHGLGSNETDLFALAPLLDPRFIVVSARAPLVLGPGAFAWFSIDFTPEGLQIEAKEGRRSCNTVIRFLAELCDASPVDRTQVFLAGFSQGAMLAAAVTMARPDLLAGTVMMSGAVAPELVPTPEADLAGFPLAQVHGMWDDVVPVELGRQARAFLEARDVDLDYREFDMGHQVTSESFEFVGGWLSRRLDRSQRNA
jgi:phospholipase/carboxylesterase